MARRRQIFEGRAKILFEGPEPGTLVQYFKDEVASVSLTSKNVISGKGVLNNRISEYLMLRLGEIGVPTHFVRRLNMREQLVREVEMIPLEVVVRNAAAGDFASRFRLAEGAPLPRSIVEFYFSSDELARPLVSEEHITAFGWAAPQDIDEIMALSLRINDFLSGLFLGIGMRLMDVKVEFGRLWEDEQMRIVLADEICPDSCRLWDLRANQPLEPDASEGTSAGHLADAYQEVARRLGILPESGPADLKGPDTVQ
ncbi:phosphoribosylaminoimidazolesuccinocarboxamide synthase [Defluviicoccus vanus]|uniref:Phosphoribosylaminoimidazole-succinocarboxamide synthase n=1 Tax=Defluviicoccus vanus TaxID=111831 RepID=A0A7H1N6K1_9PROT|nr:phosphoribosylaminoimidazolesuccinocarboxamide synthase [Defluviicoccus vanus]QNT71337.1 phosphoribosylaminoimidazolesuccinocarboxamide synthase [Defluviicoccus vanus]